MSRRVRGVAGLLLFGLLSGLILGGSASAIAPRVVGPQADGLRANGEAQTKTITRTRAAVDGSSEVVDSRRVTVKVNKTKELRGRERIKVSWSGAHPSGGRAANPYGESGMAQEYPVVILQCRGIDDPDLPAAKQLSPETCWTSTRQQRTQSATTSEAVWRHDQYASEADRAQKSGMDPYPDPETCDDVPALSTRITPFISAARKVYTSCTAETMAPEAAVGASYPPSEIAAFTNVDGTGEADFEVRTAIENESLGCDYKTDCSLVVIPIMGISCIDADPLCNKYGRFAPGSSNFANEGVDAAVSPLFWWADSNWRNRFTIPLSFALPPDACNIMDSRAPTGFYGSELMSQASLQWAPAYCLRKDRFKFQHNRMSDEAAFVLMETGQAPAAFVSGGRPAGGVDPVAYAPTAVTGFAVSFVVDKPDNAGEQTELRLTPRLLAKLLTQSYPASDLGTQHPGLEKNPLSINLDPEFQRLNEDLDLRAREAAATVLSLSQSSDVIRTLTEYIAADREAMSFIDGKPDRWGMRVNPSYKGIDLPLSEWPLLDTFIPKSEQECLKENPSVYLSQVAAPVSYLREIAEAVLDAWPNVQTRCDRATPTDPFKLGRVDRQGIGARFMLGITSLGDAARFGLRTAALETSDGRFAAPDDRSLTAALRHAKKAQPLQPFAMTQQDLGRDAAAYPGTMIVYTAARTSGMDKEEAAKVALFIRTATTEGQRPGSGNGELAAGFLPLKRTGVTAQLFAAAQAAADAIEAQKDTSGSGPEDDATGDGSPAGGDRGPGSDAPDSKTPDAKSPKGSAPVTLPVTSDDTSTVATDAQDSRLAAALLPVMLFLGLLGGLVSAFLRLRHGRSEL